MVHQGTTVAIIRNALRENRSGRSENTNVRRQTTAAPTRPVPGLSFSSLIGQDCEMTGRTHPRRKGILPDCGQTALVQLVDVTPDMLKAVDQAVLAERAYSDSTGGRRKLGVTGEIGEVLYCHTLGLKLSLDSRSEGFDAVDGKGKLVQIKTRRSESHGLPSDLGRLSTFSKHGFDYALLVVLDSDYHIAEIWRAEQADIASLIESQKRRNPNLGSFKRRASRVWPLSQD